MSLQDNIRRIEDLRKELTGLLPMSAEQQRKLDEKIRLEFHYNTNHIEGNTLTYGETKLILLFDQVVKNHKGREIEEMKASEVAYQYMENFAEDTERPFSEQFIKDLNRILLVRPYYKEAITEDGQETRRLISIGDYKQHPNSVRLENGEIFHYASPEETPIQMKELVDWYREEETKGERHSVELAALLHYRFVRIHPFDDGNGRVSRLLVNYVLHKNGLPPVIIKTNDKKNYLRALNQADAGDLNAFVTYISEQLIWTLELSTKAAKGEDVEEPSDWKKKLAVLDTKLIDKEEITLLKEEVVVNTVIEKQILKLFRNAITELSQFDKYFMFRVIQVAGSDIDKKFYTGDSEKISSGIREFFASNTDQFQNGIKLDVTHYQFRKNGENLFNTNTSVLVNFESTLFKISVTDKESALRYNVIISKYYHQNLSEDDINQIVGCMANNIIHTIDVKTQNTQ